MGIGLQLSGFYFYPDYKNKAYPPFLKGVGSEGVGGFRWVKTILINPPFNSPFSKGDESKLRVKWTKRNASAKKANSYFEGTFIR